MIANLKRNTPQPQFAINTHTLNVTSIKPTTRKCSSRFQKTTQSMNNSIVPYQLWIISIEPHDSDFNEANISTCEVWRAGGQRVAPWMLINSMHCG